MAWPAFPPPPALWTPLKLPSLTLHYITILTRSGLPKGPAPTTLPYGRLLLLFFVQTQTYQQQQVRKEASEERTHEDLQAVQCSAVQARSTDNRQAGRAG